MGTGINHCIRKKNIIFKVWESDFMSIHVLQFFSTLNNGGAENRMMDVYRCINPDIVTFDFAVVHEGKHFFDEEVYKKKSKKYVLPDPRKGLIRNYKALVDFFKKHKFQAVHTHVSWYGGIVLIAARKAGVKIRIAHARDSVIPNRSFKERVSCDIGKVLINWSATQKIAISTEAAENIFGKGTVKKGDFLFVPNSIDQKKYVVLDENDRINLRKELEIPLDAKAYVTVANLRKQKNHMFLIDIAVALKKKDDKFKLYLIGEGSLRTDIEEKINRLGLSNNVILMGSRKDVPQILCAFDGMIFPSLFEGLGGVILESQLVGVPAIVSDVIPRVVDVGIDMVEYLSLECSPEVWADTIIKKTNNYTWDYETTLSTFKQKGYCIEETAKKYLKEYGIDDKTIEDALKQKNV